MSKEIPLNKVQSKVPSAIGEITIHLTSAKLGVVTGMCQVWVVDSGGKNIEQLTVDAVREIERFTEVKKIIDELRNQLAIELI